jgi:hypothetical protein
MDAGEDAEAPPPPHESHNVKLERQEIRAMVWSEYRLKIYAWR